MSTSPHPPLSTVIRNRQSSKNYDPDKSISPEIIRSLLEAARWAPSSNNRQPWFYLVFDDRVRKERNQARECLTRGNAYARTAPLLIMAIAEEVNPDGKKNAKALHDLGLANENLFLQATSMGLHCRPMGGFDTQKARLFFSIPEGYTPTILIALGYPPPILTTPPEMQEIDEEPRSRKPIEKFARLGNWSKRLSPDD